VSLSLQRQAVNPDVVDGQNLIIQTSTVHARDITLAGKAACENAREVSGRQHVHQAARLQDDGPHICQQQRCQPHAIPRTRSACKAGERRIAECAMSTLVKRPTWEAAPHP